MEYITLKDRDFYKKLKYSSSHTLLYKTTTHVAVELILIDNNSNWHINTPFDYEFKDAEDNIKNNIKVKENQAFLDFYGKYRKWQKRKLYTIEEFNELFET